MKKTQLFKILTEALLVAAVTFLVCHSDVLGSFDTMLTDKAYQRPRAINNKIKIIGIDDDTIRELGPMGTWSRQVYADLIEALGDEPAEIVFDLMIFGDMDESGDDAFRQAAAREDIVAGSYINFRTNYRYEAGVVYIDYYGIDRVDMPIADCETGFVNAFPDEDGVLRTAALTYRYDEETIDSLAYTAYKIYCRRNGIEPTVPATEFGRINIEFAGHPGDYEKISLCKVLDGQVDKAVFKDRIVFVGAYTSGLYDQYAVPNTSDIMFGPEVQANILQALIDGVSPVHAGRRLVAAVCALIIGLLFCVYRSTELKISIPLAILSGSAYIIVCIVLCGRGILLPILYFPLADLSAILLAVIYHYLKEYRDKKQISDAFRKYISPQVFDEISGKGGFTLKLGGETRDIAVLFVDIRGFTTMSESLPPEQIVDILNSYLELTTNAIFNNGGTLDKFIGDATMAVFNAPFDLEDHIYKACRTALDIVAGGEAIESKFMEKYGKSVGFGVGVNCGKAVVGNIGCSFRMDYTAIGDTVNTAARLEANAKRGQVLISDAVYEQVKDRAVVEPIGAIPLKGKSKEVFVYSLTDLK
ncbi:MAG: adenylate/guanylate cyclase domain-containing protein [Oscillospiraceae bacterium]|nr:adenylate/guanylate cyclase domain-containing protein [Oscillospiraceae bacterium]